MPDYTRDTGSTGIMMIRDIPGENRVEFWLNSRNSTTFNHALPWSGRVNGIETGTQYYNYTAGAGWRRLGNYSISTSQTVIFRIGNTGTSGFGGPTEFSQFITRAFPPGPPSAVSFSNIGMTTVDVSFTDGAANGSPIDNRQVVYSTNPDVNAPGAIVQGSDGSHTVTGLTPGTTYYFWANCHNAMGWGPLGPRSQVTTSNVPPAPGAPTIAQVTQVSAVAIFTSDTPGLVEYQVGWGTNSSLPSFISGAVPPYLIENLTPATTYYARVRTRNSSGWSTWSPYTMFRTIAGARVKVGSAWVDAVPYVKVAGQWEVARAWVRHLGEWKETS